MREITVTYNVYKFEELSESAKETAKNNFLNTDWRNEDFSEIVNEDVKNVFPLSDVEARYELSYCQGDYFTIRGSLAYKEFYDDVKAAYVNGKLTDEDYRIFTDLLKPYTFNIRDNQWFTYSDITTSDIMDKLGDTMYQYCADWVQENPKDVGYYKTDNGKRVYEEQLWNLAEIISGKLTKYCEKMKQFGYEYLYHISDEEMQEISDANDWEYLEDGER